MEFDLDRFVRAQEENYAKALEEIKDGYKRTHWIWYIFPQIKELSVSATSKYYGLDGIEEATEYYNNEYLKNHLLEISKALLEVKNSDIEDIMGYPDYFKVRSSMTLFGNVDPEEPVFHDVIDKYYDGIEDEITLKYIKKN